MNVPDLLYRVAAVLLVVVTLLVTADVVLSYFSASHPVFRSLSKIFAVWIVMLALPKITLEDQNIRIDYVYDRLSTAQQRRITRLTRVIRLGVFAVLFVSAVAATLAFYDRGLGAIGIPTFFLYFPLALVAAVILLAYLGEYLAAVPVLDRWSSTGGE
jgi:TRAP-type C4-dicarboxylate transport system permease small subunit